MSIRHILAVMIFAILALTASAALAVIADDNMSFDLYRVFIDSQNDAVRLASLPVDPLLRVPGGYLVLTADPGADHLAASGLDYKHVASDVDRNHLALDISHDSSTRDRYPLVFEEQGIRIFRVDPDDFKSADTRLGRIRTENIPVVYQSQGRLNPDKALPQAELDSILNNISQDSLTSYIEHLQAYGERWAGTTGNIHSTFWLRDKFQDYGYDSIVIDEFKDEVAYDSVICRNIVVYKPGTDHPHHHLIIGAHRDAVHDSPGADDNGSGTAAVLEMARVLVNIETKMTIVFILFDAEEAGLIGSWHYAEDAYERGDRIGFMLNMDMIGNYENDYDAKLYYDDFDSACTAMAQIWATLADSIPGIDITGHLEGSSGGSDHVPFESYGYTALFVHEHIFSDVYHSSHDSAVYLDFDYLARMTKASLAAAYVISRQFVPEYELYIYAPEAMPEVLAPNTPSEVTLLVREYGGAQIVPDGVRLHYAVNDGPSGSTNMVPSGVDLFTGYLPPLACADRLRYYISIEEDSLGMHYYPGEGLTLGAFSATEIIYLFDDHFDEDLGWTVSGEVYRGDWVRDTIPYFTYCPPAGYNNSFWFYATGHGFVDDLDDGTTILTSPTIDASGGTILVEYATWFVNDLGDAPYEDSMQVFISNDDGAYWTLVETIGPVDGADGEWHLKQHWLSDLIEPSSTIRLRFEASDLGDDSFVKAAVDAVRFVQLGTDLTLLTESLPDWTADHPYDYQLQAAICEGGLTWTDKFNQLDATGLFLSSDGLISGTATESKTILFTAQVSDDFGSTEEKKYTFYINPALTISTSSIPAATLGESYSAPLSSSGGTGDKSWIDRDGDLIGSGVTLGSNGNLSGTPVEDGDISFVAQVTDQVGATAEKTFTLHVVGPYICGDASGDSAVNVADAVWIINYIFSGGPAPYPIEAGDTNADGDVTVADAVYIINYVFKGGPEPQCP